VTYRTAIAQSSVKLKFLQFLLTDRDRVKISAKCADGQVEAKTCNHTDGCSKKLDVLITNEADQYEENSQREGDTKKTWTSNCG